MPLPRSEMDAKVIARGEHVMAVCNACRYCEGYCPVFPAMENRMAFAKGDLMYLANLCHNCGECLYACQYAPPHEFGINVPQLMAQIRVGSYEEFCWPAFLRPAFRRSGIAGSLALVVVSAVVLQLFVSSSATRGDFYTAISHDALVGIFGAVGLFVIVALAISLNRAWRSFGSPVASGFSRPSGAPEGGHYVRALRDVMTLRHLHGTGTDCTDGIERRSPWRRWFHHCTYYGFLLCFASTTVAAVYHTVFGWRAPYAFDSAPVILGTLGGAALVVGPAGLLALRRRRDPSMIDSSQRGLDESFIVMLLMTSVTGLLLLVLRGTAAMTPLLVVHLGFVLALFLTLPYGKFVHGLYRTAALVRSAAEERR
jgi:citrate/tricarballylate utilization protein